MTVKEFEQRAKAAIAMIERQGKRVAALYCAPRELPADMPPTLFGLPIRTAPEVTPGAVWAIMATGE